MNSVLAKISRQCHPQEAASPRGQTRTFMPQNADDLRLHRRRRRQRRLRARQPPDRVRPAPRAAARGGRRRTAHLWIHMPLGYGKLFTDRQVQLALQDRAGAGTRRPPDHPAARQGARRIELDQRPALHARPGRGLRPLAPARQCRLELRRCAAVFPQGRGSASAARTTCTAPAGRSRSPMSASRIRCAKPSSMPRSRPAFRATTISTAPTRKARAISRLTTRERAALRRPRSAISSRRAGARNLTVVAERAGDAHPVRGPARGRRRISARAARRTPRAPTARSSSPAARSTRRSCCSFPASARPSCCARIGIRGDRRHAGRRRRPAGPFSGRMHYRCTEPITMNDVVKQLAPRRRAPGCATRCSGAGCSPSAPAMPGGFFLRTRPVVATPDVQVHSSSSVGRTSAATLHPVSGFTAVCHAAAGEPRLRAHQVGRSAAAAGDPAATISPAPMDRDTLVAGMKLCAASWSSRRCGATSRRSASRAGAARATTTARLCARAARRSSIRPAPAAWAGCRRRRRRAAARARLRRAARRRCLDHADGRVRQHQRGDRHDRRKGRRHDPGGRQDKGRGQGRLSLGSDIPVRNPLISGWSKSRWRTTWSAGRP